MSVTLPEPVEPPIAGDLGDEPASSTRMHANRDRILVQAYRAEGAPSLWTVASDGSGTTVI